MKKTIIKLTNSLILLMAVLAMTGCNSDGDETIAEYVKKHDWEVEMDEPGLYRAYNEGYYPTDHVECTITECEIKK